MPSMMDKSGPMPVRAGLERGPVARWIFIAHRIVSIVVVLLAIYVVLAAIVGAFFGGQSLATRLIYLWHQIYTIWT